MKRLLILPALLYCAAIVCAADPTLQGETLVPEYRLVKFKVIDLEPKDSVRWRVYNVDPKASRNEIDRSELTDPSWLNLAAPPGHYVAEALIVRPTADGSFSIITLERDFEIFKRPVPGPNPPVVPDEPVKPPTPPKPPEPSNPELDTALVAKYKAALKSDIEAKFPGGGTKEAARALASVYLTAAEMMGGDDEEQWPKTVAEMYTRFANAASAKKVPRPPYLGAVRDVSGAYLGSYSSDKAIDKTLRLDLAGKYKAAGLALTKGAE